MLTVELFHFEILLYTAAPSVTTFLGVSFRRVSIILQTCQSAVAQRTFVSTGFVYWQPTTVMITKATWIEEQVSRHHRPEYYISSHYATPPITISASYKFPSPEDDQEAIMGQGLVSE